MAKFTLHVSKDENGLWSALSNDAVPGFRLFIECAESMAEALALVPGAIEKLENAAE